MAKITHNAIIADIRGRRGNKVYTIYRGSHITRTYNPNPTDHKTPRQLQIRGLMGNLMTCYWNLPVEYQELWEKYGQRKYDTKIGRGAFIQANIRLLSANHPELTQIDHPPPTPSTPPSIAGFNWFFPNRTTARISWTAPLVSTHFIQISHRLNWNYSASYNLYWAQVKTLRSDCGQYDWSHPYPPDTEVHLKLRVIDTWGKTSPFTHTIKEVVPIADLIDILNRKLSSMDFWSDYADITLDTIDSAKTHAKTVTIPTIGAGSIPDGATIHCVHILFKTRVISNSNAVDNAINIATCELQVKKGAAGSYINSMTIPDNSWFVEKKITWGGDAIEGDENLSTTVTEPDTYYFQIAHGKVDGNYLILRDVAWGLRVWWY